MALIFYNMFTHTEENTETTVAQAAKNNITTNIHVIFNNTEFDVVIYHLPLENILLEKVPSLPMILPPSYDEYGIYKYYVLP